MISFGARLQQLRKKYNYTQEEIAKLCGVSSKAISRYENDTAQPGNDTIIRLARIFKTDVNDLFNFKASSHVEQEFILNGVEITFLEDFRKCSKKTQVLLKNFVAGLSKNDEVTYLENKIEHRVINEKK